MRCRQAQIVVGREVQHPPSVGGGDVAFVVLQTGQVAQVAFDAQGIEFLLQFLGKVHFLSLLFCRDTLRFKLCVLVVKSYFISATIFSNPPVSRLSCSGSMTKGGIR